MQAKGSVERQRDRGDRPDIARPHSQEIGPSVRTVPMRGTRCHSNIHTSHTHLRIRNICKCESVPYASFVPKLRVILQAVDQHRGNPAHWDCSTERRVLSAQWSGRRDSKRSTNHCQRDMRSLRTLSLSNMSILTTRKLTAPS